MPVTPSPAVGCCWPPPCRLPGTGDRGTAGTYRQGSLASAALSTVFAVIIFVHEVALEGGVLDVRNYVVIGFCGAWVVTAGLVVTAAYKRAHFLLLPWLLLTAALTPLFLVALVAGAHMMAHCVEQGKVGALVAAACLHEYHVLGTTEPAAAAGKLALLAVMLLLNMASLLVVYRYLLLLSAAAARRRKGALTSEEDDDSLPPGVVSVSHDDRLRDDTDQRLLNSEW